MSYIVVNFYLILFQSDELAGHRGISILFCEITGRICAIIG